MTARQSYQASSHSNQNRFSNLCRTGLDGTVEGHGPEDRREVVADLYRIKSALPDYLGKESLDVVGSRTEAVEYLDEIKQGAHDHAGGLAPVSDVQLPAGFEYSMYLLHGGDLLGSAQMVKKQA